VDPVKNLIRPYRFTEHKQSKDLNLCFWQDKEILANQSLNCS